MWYHTFVLMAVASSLSGAIGGHELIHRSKRLHVALGRLLLASVLYEHFFAEHMRGHHVRFATREDPATARRGETFWAYLARSPFEQFASAWRLGRNDEAARDLRPPAPFGGLSRWPRRWTD